MGEVYCSQQVPHACSTSGIPASSFEMLLHWGEVGGGSLPEHVCIEKPSLSKPGNQDE